MIVGTREKVTLWLLKLTWPFNIFPIGIWPRYWIIIESFIDPECHDMINEIAAIKGKQAQPNFLI